MSIYMQCASYSVHVPGMGLASLKPRIEFQFAENVESSEFLIKEGRISSRLVPPLTCTFADGVPLLDKGETDLGILVLANPFLVSYNLKFCKHIFCPVFYHPDSKKQNSSSTVGNHGCSDSEFRIFREIWRLFPKISVNW